MRTGTRAGTRAQSPGITAALTALLVVLGVAGCSPEHAGGPAVPPASPLDQLLAGPGGEDGEALREELHRRVQAGTADCMAELGFDYRPIPFEAAVAPSAAEGMSAAQEAAEFGFYVSIEDPPPEFGADPNEEHVDDLPETEAQAWLAGLLGEQTTDDDGALVNEGGCLRDAQAQIFGSIADQQEVIALRRELDDRIAVDRRWQELDERWRARLADAGFVYESEEEIIEDLRRRLDAIDDQDALERLRAEERRIAVAAVECDDGVDEERRAIVAEYELEFIDSNAALIDRVRIPTE
ncbi:MAG: hypothetical protein AAGF02_13635 [Actinomycetota bacterium]